MAFYWLGGGVGWLGLGTAWSSLDPASGPKQRDPLMKSLISVGRNEWKVVSVVYPSHFEYQQPAR